MILVGIFSRNIQVFEIHFYAKIVQLTELGKLKGINILENIVYYFIAN